EAVLSKQPDLAAANKYQLEGYNTFQRLYPGIWPKDQEKPPFAMPDETRIAMLRMMEVVTQTAVKERGQKKDLIEAALHQFILYDSLKKSFASAWAPGEEKPDPGKITRFWNDVMAAKRRGRLVDGWNEDVPDPNHVKGDKVVNAAREYAAIAAHIGKKAVTLPRIVKPYERIRDH
ncbi:MAG TPA: hypothetical protein VEF76_14695, partial [Patescibacteria group bacterium]|nr:hypothetical protein [Patescibacteria group bacterium]